MATIRTVEGNLYEFGCSATTHARAVETGEALFKKGLEADEAGKTDEALSFYRQALTHNPQAAKIMVNIGKIEFIRRNLGAAEEVCRKAVEVDPYYPLAHFNLACCLAEKWPPQRDEAIEHYRKALALKPNYADAHFNLAVELGWASDTRREAIQHWRAYLRYGGNDESWQRTAKREIERLRAQDLQIVTKPANPEQLKRPVADLQIG